ncbi:MAG: phosphoglycerate mutase, partial [Prevotella sp.]|nr:phosphoglycerate mutase [Prevotella sp.]
HVEATDEAGHDGDIALKLKAIDYLDQRLLKPIIKAIEEMDEPVCVAVLPDHPTPVEMHIHVNEPVPFLIWHKDISADEVHYYDEESCQQGAYGTLESDEFIKEFMSIN